MKTQFEKTRFWMLFYVVYLFIVPIILSVVNVSILPTLWLIGLVITLIILFIQLSRTDKVIAQDKELKKKVSKTLSEYLKIFLGKELVLFILFIGYLLALRFFNIDLSIWRIVVGGIVITIFYYVIYRKGILGFLSPNKVGK